MVQPAGSVPSRSAAHGEDCAQFGAVLGSTLCGKGTGVRQCDARVQVKESTPRSMRTSSQAMLHRCGGSGGVPCQMAFCVRSCADWWEGVTGLTLP